MTTTDGQAMRRSRTRANARPRQTHAGRRNRSRATWLESCSGEKPLIGAKGGGQNACPPGGLRYVNSYGVRGIEDDARSQEIVMDAESTSDREHDGHQQQRDAYG